jgi:hypothetical protein
MRLTHTERAEAAERAEKSAVISGRLAFALRSLRD